MSVRSSQRHTKAHRCPVCGGADQDPRGADKRCFGFTSEDGWVHCSREELAGAIDQGSDGCFAHKMSGSCKCGTSHGEEVSRVIDMIETTFDYRDERGALLFQVVRFAGKNFRQRAPDGQGGWTWRTAGIRRVLYRMPELLKADPSAEVFVCEGEKDVETVRKLGAVATCNPMGARKWGLLSPDAVAHLHGRVVTVLADNDSEGLVHAEQVRAGLQGRAKSVRILRAPSPYKDITDYAAAGGGLDTLEPLTEAEPEKAPEAAAEPPKVEPSRAEQLAPETPFDKLWAPIPEVSLVIPAMGICPGPAHLVAGSWYTGKTLFLLAMGLAVASGSDVFGLWRAQRGKWIHFDHEMGERAFFKYIQRVRAGLGIEAEAVRGNVSARLLPKLNLCTPDAVDMYCELLSGRALCTIDPLRAAAPGQDENSSEYRQWIDLLNVVSNKTGCAIALLHHGGKPAEGAKRRNTGRGTSAIDDAVQSKFVLTAEEKGAPILVSHEKSRELTSPLEDFWLEIVNDGPAVRLVHRNKDEMDDGEAAKRLRDIEKAKVAIVAYLASVGGSAIDTRAGLLGSVKGQQGPKSKALTTLCFEKRIIKEGRGDECRWTLS